MLIINECEETTILKCVIVYNDDIDPIELVQQFIFSNNSHYCT
jgi:hypothetical protein